MGINPLLNLLILLILFLSLIRSLDHQRGRSERWKDGKMAFGFQGFKYPIGEDLADDCS